MSLSILQRAAAAALLAGALAPTLAGAQAGAHPSVKRPFDPPPAADLSYAVRARQHGLSVRGESLTRWRVKDGQYTLEAETQVPLLGKIVEHQSEGALDDYGLAPRRFYEKRFRREPATTTFRRDDKRIVFSESAQSYPIKGGEQDRLSAAWQLLAVARAAPEKFTPGSEWAFFVAGRRDAEAWRFKVIERATLATGEGEVDTLHLVRMAPPDAPGQQVDLWLAPALDWYPVRLRFADGDDDFVEQTLQKIARK